MVTQTVREIIIERDKVICARREALRRMAAADGRNKIQIHYETFQPLNHRLLELNRKIGL